MSKATPDAYDDLKVAKKQQNSKYRKTLKELSKRFYSVDNGYYLEKALQLLAQFQAGRLNNIKKIKRKDIRQLNPIELEFVLQNLRDVFGCSVIDKSFKSTPMLDTAYTMLYEIKTQKDKYISFVDNVFIYNGKKLSIKTGGHIHSFLKGIYNLSRGITCDISYVDLFNEMKRINPNKYNKKEEIDKNLRKYITTKKDGLFKIIKQEELNGRPLIDTDKGYGIKFNNG